MWDPLLGLPVHLLSCWFCSGVGQGWDPERSRAAWKDRERAAPLFCSAAALKPFPRDLSPCHWVFVCWLVSVQGQPSQSPPACPCSVARRHAPGARHQVPLAVRRLLPGPAADVSVPLCPPAARGCGALQLALPHAKPTAAQGSVLQDAPQPHQRLRHDRPQGLLPPAGLRLHAQQLAVPQVC